MIFIYHCYGGTHSSVLAATYHLNRLNDRNSPTKDELFKIPLFNKLIYGNIGELFFHGVDNEGNKVYTMGIGKEKHMIAAQYNLVTMLQKQNDLKQRIIFSNTLPTVPLCMKIGGLFSRWLKIDIIGIPFLVLGCRQSYKNLVKLVQHTKQVEQKSDKQIIILDNDQFKS